MSSKRRALDAINACSADVSATPANEFAVRLRTVRENAEFVVRLPVQDWGTGSGDAGVGAGWHQRPFMSQGPDRAGEESTKSPPK